MIQKLITVFSKQIIQNRNHSQVQVVGIIPMNATAQTMSQQHIARSLELAETRI
jgi:hypothetical protein